MNRENSSLKIGLLTVSLTWFLFTAYQLIKGVFNRYTGAELIWISRTDTAGAFGMAFRTIAALIAVLTILYFIINGDLKKPNLFRSIKLILIGEIVYFLSFGF